MQKLKFRNLAMQLAGALVIFYGIFTGYKGYLLISKPEMIKSKMIKMHQELNKQLKAKQ